MEREASVLESDGKTPFRVKSSISVSNKSNQVCDPTLRWFEFTGVKDNWIVERKNALNAI